MGGVDAVSANKERIASLVKTPLDEIIAGKLESGNGKKKLKDMDIAADSPYVVVEAEKTDDNCASTKETANTE